MLLEAITNRRTGRRTGPRDAALCGLALAWLSAIGTAQSQDSRPPELVSYRFAIGDASWAERWRRWHEIGSARLYDWLSDGSLLVGDDRANGHRLLRLRGPGAAPLSMVDSATPWATVSGQAYRNERLLLLANAGGGGADTLELRTLALDSTAETNAAPMARFAGQARFAHDGQRIAYCDHPAVSTLTHCYVLDGEGSLPRLVGSVSEGRAALWGWSLDDRYLLLSRHAAGASDQLVVLDVAIGEHTVTALAGERSSATETRRRHTQRQLADDEAWRLHSVRFGIDGRSVLALASVSGETQRLFEVQLADGAMRALSPEGIGPLRQFDASADGRLIAYSYEQHGVNRLAIMALRGAEPATVRALPAGNIGALRFERRGPRLAFELATDDTPTNVYVLDPASGALHRWTERTPLAAGLHNGITAERLRFPSWERHNGRSQFAEAQLYRPRDRAPRGVLVRLAATSGPAVFEPWVQFAAHELGLAVVIVRTQDKLLRDLGALLVYLRNLPGFADLPMATLGRHSTARQAIDSLAQFSELLCCAAAIDAALSNRDAAQVKRPLLIAQSAGNDRSELESLLFIDQGLANTVVRR